MIAVLLSTYKPKAEYLQAQVASIEAQSVPCKLIVRDDSETRLGAMGSFERLLEENPGYAYYAFADQDDVWKPNKLESMLDIMRLAEGRHGVETPLLVHCDLEVVDEKLRTIAPSFWEYTNIRPAIIDSDIHYLAISNCVTGCATLFNTAAREAALPFRSSARMHDSEVALRTKMAGGQVIPMAERLIQYRQHGENTLGAVDVRKTTLRQRWEETEKIYRAQRELFGNRLNFLYWKIRYWLARR